MKRINVLVIGLLAVIVSACGLFNEKNKGKGFNLFTVQQDVELGSQVAAEIDGDPQTYPLLDSVQYKDVYDYVYKVRDKILNTG